MSVIATMNLQQSVLPKLSGVDGRKVIVVKGPSEVPEAGAVCGQCRRSATPDHVKSRPIAL